MQALPLPWLSLALAIHDDSAHDYAPSCFQRVMPLTPAQFDAHFSLHFIGSTLNSSINVSQP